MNTFILLLICTLFIGLYIWTVRLVQRNILWNKYKIVIDMFDYFLDKAYNVIYTDQLIGYTSSGTNKPPKEEFETIERNFIKLTLEIMGEENNKLLVSFYGDDSTIINNAVIYFRKRLEHDELVKVIKSNIPT